MFLFLTCAHSSNELPGSFFRLRKEFWPWSFAHKGTMTGSKDVRSNFVSLLNMGVLFHWWVSLLESGWSDLFVNTTIRHRELFGRLHEHSCTIVKEKKSRSTRTAESCIFVTAMDLLSTDIASRRFWHLFNKTRIKFCLTKCSNWFRLSLYFIYW